MDICRKLAFPNYPRLNDEIVTEAGRVIVLLRRNLLQRYISGVISQQLRYWIGTRSEFIARLDDIQLRAFRHSVCKAGTYKAREDQQRRLKLVESSSTEHIAIYYEDLFDESITFAQQQKLLNEILDFLSFRPFSDQELDTDVAFYLDRDKNKWSTSEVYERIPKIRDLHSELASDEFGYLFK